MTNLQIDKLLLEISSAHQYFLIDPEKEHELMQYRRSINYLINELKLIRQPFENSGLVELTQFGKEVEEKGGWIKYLEIEQERIKKIENRRALDFEKTKVDLELAKKMLKEYPRTKWFARIGFVIAVILALVEFIKFLSNLKSTN